MRRARAAFFLSLLTIGAASTCDRTAAAQAQPAGATPSSNEAAAEALFGEARTLIESGRIEEGCGKLEASQKLDPGTGTLIHLADCYEKLGRTATSWARFREAASRAARDGRTDWESVAKTRAAELEPKLAKLRIDAPQGVVVKRDGDEIPAAALGTALPIDPGEHVLVASAPGKRSWTGRVTSVASSLAEVKVPPLEDDPDAAAREAEHATSSGSSLRTVGYVMGAVGIVGVTVGVITGLSAISLNNRSKQICPSNGVCADESARADNDSARSSATISTIGFVAGGLLLAGGLALVIAAPSSRAPASAALRASPNALWLEGTW
jgi:hypothetical protein